MFKTVLKKMFVLVFLLALDGLYHCSMASISSFQSSTNFYRSRIIGAITDVNYHSQRMYASTRVPIRVHYDKEQEDSNINIRPSWRPLTPCPNFLEDPSKTFLKNEWILIPEAPPPPEQRFKNKTPKALSRKDDSLVVVPRQKKPPIQFSVESIDLNNLVIPPPPDPLPLTPKELMKQHKLEQKNIESLKHRNLMEAYPFEGRSIVFLAAISFVQLFIKYVFIDLEYTGLGDLHKITEIGAVKTHGFIPTGNKFSTLINPQRSVNFHAHKITGYTLKQLSKYPTFTEIYDNFLSFIKDSVIVFHYGRNDMKYLKREIAQAGGPEDPFQSNIILDTFPILDKIFPEDKKSLSSVAEKYGIDITMRVRHNALLDAEILADVFQSMLKDLKLGIFLPDQWKKVDHQAAQRIFQSFLPLQETKALESLKKYGMTLSLPPECRFVSKAYHLGLGRSCDAIAIDFSNDKKELCKVLMSYYVPQGFENAFVDKQKPSFMKKQMFFGWYEQETISFINGPRQTVFVGGIMGALLAREVLLGERGEEVLSKLGIEAKTFSVLACPSVYLLDTLSFSHETKNIILLVDNFDKHDDLLKNSLKECVNKHCVRNFLPLLNLSVLESNLLRFIIKYNGHNWTVVEDQKQSKSRILKLERTPQEHLTFELDEYHKTIKSDGKIIPDPATQVLVSHAPEVLLRTIAFHYEKGGEMALTDKILYSMSHYADRMLQALSMNSIRDVIFIDRVERARITYERAQPITLNSPAYQYLKKRGITCDVPASFRTADDVYHPWLNRSFQAIIMPLMDASNKMIGIHQIFFEQDGTPLKIQRSQGEKIPNKVSLGKTVGGVTEIYRSPVGVDDKVDVTLVSEGGENALVVKDTLDYLKDKNPSIRDGIMRHFGSTNVLNIKSCVGINGIVDVPLEKSTHTVVILADNDAANVDAKKTIIETSRKFLECGMLVHIVLPKSKDGQIKKIDLNDLYIEYSDKKYEQIVRLLLGSVVIKSLEDLGPPEDPLQISLEKLAKAPPILSDVSFRETLSKFYKEPQPSHILSLGSFGKKPNQPPNRTLYSLKPLISDPLLKKSTLDVPSESSVLVTPEDDTSKK
jgi:DNA polymerase-3 subunit epsilon